MTIDSEISEKHRAEYARLYSVLKPARGLRRKVTCAYLCLAAMLIGLLLLIAAMIDGVRHPLRMTLPIVGMLILVGWLWRKIAKQQKAYLASVYEGSKGTITMTETGMSTHAKSVHAEVAWAGIQSWVRGKETVIFRHVSGCDLLEPIPADPATAASLFELLERRLPSMEVRR